MTRTGTNLNDARRAVWATGEFFFCVFFFKYSIVKNMSSWMRKNSMHWPPFYVCFFLFSLHNLVDHSFSSVKDHPQVIDRLENTILVLYTLSLAACLSVNVGIEIHRDHPYPLISPSKLHLLAPVASVPVRSSSRGATRESVRHRRTSARGDPSMTV